MKRISKPQSKSYLMLSLQLKDIEEIYSLLSANCDSVTLEDDEYEYASPSDLRQRGRNKLTHLEIHGFRPYVHLTLRRNFNQLYVREPDEMTSAALWTKLDNILMRNVNPLNWIRSIWVSVSLVVSFIAVVTILNWKGKSINHWIADPIYYTVFGVIFVYQQYLTYRRRAVIHLSSTRSIGQILWTERGNILAVLTLIVTLIAAMIAILRQH